MVGARLISHAGSLTSLAKYPASTVQILGAEKALFRALKVKHYLGFFFSSSLFFSGERKYSQIRAHFSLEFYRQSFEQEQGSHQSLSRKQSLFFILFCD
jgi:hypothetical protein